MSNDVDLFMASPSIMNMIIPSMLKRLNNHKQQFIFTFCILEGYPQKLAADILNIHETNIAREMQRIRTKLVHFKKGYPDIGKKYVKKPNNQVIIEEYAHRPTQQPV